MSDTATEPTATPTPDPEPVAPVEEPLGEAGKRALEAERKRAKAAEKDRDQWAAKVKEYEDAQKSEAERLAARVKDAEDKAAKAEAKAARAEIVNELGIPADIAADIAGNTPEEFRAAAERVKAHLAAAAPPRFAGTANQGPQNVADTGPKQLTQTDLTGMTPAQIEAARVGGQLNSLLGIR